MARHTVWLIIAAAAAIALPLQAPQASAREHWFVIPRLDGAIGFDAESIDVDARNGIIVTVGAYSPEPFETRGGLAAHYAVDEAHFDCAGRFNIRSTISFDAARRRIWEKREMTEHWRSVSSSLYIAINAAVCDSMPLQKAREAYSMPDALKLMQQVAQ